ncbi:MAG: Rab family GTPase [Candidatus Helarchaeota archaeon]
MQKKIFKIVVGGDGGVGKTTYLHRFCDGIFIADTKLTVGVNFFSKSIEYNDIDLTLSIWDLGGQEQFRFLHEQYISGARGGLICFALDMWSSFLHVSNWVELLTKIEPSMKMVLVGMRSDLERDGEKISDDDIQEIVDKYEMLRYIRTSSKTGQGVEDPINTLLDHFKQSGLL